MDFANYRAEGCLWVIKLDVVLEPGMTVKASSYCCRRTYGGFLQLETTGTTSFFMRLSSKIEHDEYMAESTNCLWRLRLHFSMV